MIRKTLWLSGFLILTLSVPHADASETNGPVNISVAPEQTLFPHTEARRSGFYRNAIGQMRDIVWIECF